MRDIVYAIVVGFGVLAIGLWLACTIATAQDPDTQLHNAYWPFTVETSVRDR